MIASRSAHPFVRPPVGGRAGLGSINTASSGNSGGFWDSILGAIPGVIGAIGTVIGDQTTRGATPPIIPVPPTPAGGGTTDPLSSLSDVELIRRYPALKRRIESLESATSNLRGRIAGGLFSSPSGELVGILAQQEADTLQARREFNGLTVRLRSAVSEAIQAGTIRREDVSPYGLAGYGLGALPLLLAVGVAAAILATGAAVGLPPLIRAWNESMGEREGRLLLRRAAVDRALSNGDPITDPVPSLPQPDSAGNQVFKGGLGVALAVGAGFLLLSQFKKGR